MGTRITVELADFLRVTVQERAKHDTVDKAAAALGMTVDSFKQRLSKSRKRYPAIYGDVPKYTSGNGPKVATEAEALAILEGLKPAPKAKGKGKAKTKAPATESDG